MFLHSLQTKILHFVVLHFVDLILLRKCFILISFLKNILSTESPLHNLLAKSLISTVLKKEEAIYNLRMIFCQISDEMSKVNY